MMSYPYPRLQRFIFRALRQTILERTAALVVEVETRGAEEQVQLPKLESALLDHLTPAGDADQTVVSQPCWLVKPASRPEFPLSTIVFRDTSAILDLGFRPF